MKKLFLILTMVAMTLTASAQMRISPKMEISQKTYEEAIELMRVMTSPRHDRCEYGWMSHKHLATYYGEIYLEKESEQCIRVSIAEFTEMLDYCISNPHRGIYGVHEIQTELILQTAKMYEYLSVRLAKDKRVRGMNILMDDRTGGAYIEVYFYVR
jgi:hypothetical protein